MVVCASSAVGAVRVFKAGYTSCVCVGVGIVVGVTRARGHMVGYGTAGVVNTSDRVTCYIFTVARSGVASLGVGAVRILSALGDTCVALASLACGAMRILCAHSTSCSCIGIGVETTVTLAGGCLAGNNTACI